MYAPIRLRNTLALLGAVALAAIALGQSVSADLHVPAARILVAECQGFEALATAGGQPMTCNAGVAVAPDAAPTPVHS